MIPSTEISEVKGERSEGGAFTLDGADGCRYIMGYRGRKRFFAYALLVTRYCIP